MSKIWSNIVALLTTMGVVNSVGEKNPFTSAEQRVGKASKHNPDGSRKSSAQKKREKRAKTRAVVPQAMVVRSQPKQVTQKPAVRPEALVLASSGEPMAPLARVAQEAPKQVATMMTASAGRVKAKQVSLPADEFRRFMHDKIIQIISNRKNSGAEFDPERNLRRLINDDAQNASLVKSILRSIVQHSTPNRSAAERLLLVVEKLEKQVKGETQGKSVVQRYSSLANKLDATPLFDKGDFFSASQSLTEIIRPKREGEKPMVRAALSGNGLSPSRVRNGAKDAKILPMPVPVKMIHKPTHGGAQAEGADLEEIDISRPESRTSADRPQPIREAWGTIAAAKGPMQLRSSKLSLSAPRELPIAPVVTSRRNFADKVAMLEVNMDGVAVRIKMGGKSLAYDLRKKVLTDFQDTVKDYLDLKRDRAKGRELRPEEREAEQILQKMVGKEVLDRMVLSKSMPTPQELGDLFKNTYLKMSGLRVASPAAEEKKSFLERFFGSSTKKHDSTIMEATTGVSPKTPTTSGRRIGSRGFHPFR